MSTGPLTRATSISQSDGIVTYSGSNQGFYYTPFDVVMSAFEAMLQTVSGEVATCSTIAELKASTTFQVPGLLVQVGGYYALGDGGGGPVRYFVSGYAPGSFVDNGGSIIVPSGGNGSAAWLWVNRSDVNVRWFGALGNGVSDDSVKIQSAINSMTVGSVYLPSGSYIVSSTITLPGQIYLTGDGFFATEVKQVTTNIPILSVSGSRGGINRITLRYIGTPVAGATALVSVSPSFVGSEFYIENCYKGMDISIGPAQVFSDFFIDNYVSVGIQCTTVNDCYFRSFILNAGNATNGALGGIRLSEKCEALVFEACDVLYGVFSLTTSAAVNAIGVRPAYCNFTDCFFDSSDKQVAVLDKTVETTFTNCWFSGGRGGAGFNGVVPSNCDSLIFSQCRFFNCGGSGVALSSSSSRLIFSSCAFESNSVTTGVGVSDGINVNNTTDFSIVNCIAHNGLYTGQQRYGIRVQGTADRYIVTGNLVTGNVTGGVSDVGTGLNKTVASNY